MKVLMINYMETTAPGGINKTVREIARNMSKMGHEIIVVQSNPLNLDNEEIYENFKIIRIPSICKNYLMGINPELHSYLKNYQDRIAPDVVHIHGVHSLLSFQCILIIKYLNDRLPIIFSPHLDVAKSTLAGNYLWNIYTQIGVRIFKSVTHITSCSNFEANNIAHMFDVSPDKISIIPHGVDSIDLIKPCNVTHNIRLVYSGYLIKRKNVDYLLSGLNSLIYDYGVEKVLLTIIGEGPEKKTLLKMANRLKLTEHVIFKPFLPRDELIQEIKGSDIFLLLSESEAYGIVVAEALSQGTPCIVSNSTALNEFTNEIGCYGIDCPSDSRKLAQLILDIYEKKLKVGPLSNKIRTWDKVAEDYELLYNMMLYQNQQTSSNLQSKSDPENQLGSIYKIDSNLH
ncbi:MAG: glycosyltransferase family 4 protein [Methanosarcina mazei]